MIESLTCNIWDLHPHANIVIPTNIGWTKEGKNVMGAGLAAQAAQRFPKLAYFYGQYCKKYGSETEVIPWAGTNQLILFPVKPLNVEKPWLSWQQPASLDLIRKSAEELEDLATSGVIEGLTAVPLVGCGNGKLSEKDVLPILREELDSRFILVRPK